MYIPAEYKKDFIILSEAVKEMENVFSDLSNKKRYDEELSSLLVLVWMNR